MKLAVNGRFYAARRTGVQRVAEEVVSRVARRDGVEVTLHLPAGTRAPDALDRRVSTVAGVLRGPAWELVELPYRRRSNGRTNGNGRPHAGEVLLDPANAGSVVGRPRVMLLHDVFPITNPEWYGPAFRLWFRTVVAGAARSAERVVMFSDWARTQAVDTLGLDPGRVAVAPQGTAPFDAPPPPELVERTLVRFGLERGFVLAPGSGDRRKNVDFLLETFRLWRSRDPEAPELVVVGESFPHVHATSSEARPNGVRGIGFVTDEELWALYAAAAAFCFPSHAEGFGRFPLEAMASGTPVVVADYGCAREVLGDAATVVPLDPAAWVEALAGIVSESGEERCRRVRAGRTRAARFSWDDTVDVVLGACRAALEEGNGAPGVRNGPAVRPSGNGRTGGAGRGRTRR